MRPLQIKIISKFSNVVTGFVNKLQTLYFCVSLLKGEENERNTFYSRQHANG